MLPEGHVTKALPVAGTPARSIADFLASIAQRDPHAHFARAFRGTQDVQEVAKAAYAQFMSDNGFFSMYLPYMQQIEQEVIAMGVSLLHPQPDSTGNFVSGGTEANFSALHAARQWARVHKPHIRTPNVVAPFTIHPTFQKSARYLDCEVVTTELDANGRGIPEKIAAAIDENTIMVAASAPSWHYSNIDPIPEIAAIAAERQLWMHVDGCVGGYLSPFLEKLGVKLTPWDFRVPGVSSISADLHKFGYCLKPASTIYWRSRDLQQYHYVEVNDPHLGAYKMAGFAGSRSAGPIFAAWAVMTYLGEEGYLRLTRRLLESKQRLTDAMTAIPGLHVWNVDVMPMHFHSTQAPTAAINQGLLDKGWIMLGLVHPEAITIALDPAFSDEDIELFLRDLRDVVETLLRDGAGKKGDIRYG